ncbi:Serine/threonine-protein kinase [Phytophthora fragariae]|uniref:Serine/threonine-protein kinase n=1 Tax=Phytophthora fragariae TaxID=53985 RepID=A0A6A3Z8S6_9STRA|nr:Serine/threonine-protein kinase [Phytophthora fragariae]KAE8946683.1 Serine/threonine-protein kinase [Phytophthora fragariae]KAE9026123.1 Serine/threonine-protein kinase [Phytophthora fragariae]KAE9133008.1 Serine/threonine-protein kinase [Phytophthora fragariae]KAE9133470.1 Serine/threonine-protein kinase [Phytophthora fragariae]
MPLCAACCVTKGFNKFHGGQRHLPRPVCKECFRTGKEPVDLGGEPEALLIRTPGDKKTASLADFQLLSVIGQGAFGKVLLVRHSTTGKVHAMKIISKQFVIDMDSVHYMKTERDVMTKIRHPFVIGLNYAFQTESKVYLVMEYQSGGELFSYLKEEGTFTEDAVRFYLAEMILALEHLHAHGIIHRDLKPENVLISAEGHIKLTDFGLAKEYVDGQELLTVCGTKEYMAPEMLLGKGYDSAVDWWSLGALAYEMLTGNPPFRSKNAADLQKKIISAKAQLPRWLSGEAHSLIKSLLERNVSKRLGGGKSSMFVMKGVQAIKRHSFFKRVDWEKMETLRVPPPKVPSVTDDVDTSNFDKEFTSMPASDLMCDAVIEEHNNLFRGFSFCRQDSLKEIISNPQSPINTTRLPTIASLVIDGDDIKDINDAIATAASKQPTILT